MKKENSKKQQKGAQDKKFKNVEKTQETKIKKTEIKEDNKESIKVEQETNNASNNKTKLRRNLVLFVIAIATIVLYIVERGNYLEIKEIGESYIPVFWKNFRAISITTILNFAFIFSIIYINTNKIRRTLKTFFEEEKIAFPALPRKSIAFIIAIIVTIFTSQMILEKALLCFNSAKFMIATPVLGYDIGYFVFIWPFVELIIQYLAACLVGLIIYSGLYYLIVFNVYFDGISRETLKKSTMISHLLRLLKLLIIAFAGIILVGTQNIGVQKFVNLNSGEFENYSLFGAGTTEVYIKFGTYIILAFVIIFSAFRAIKQFKLGNTRKVVKNIAIVPAYLLIVLVIMLGYNLIFVNSNELDKEKEFIKKNIEYTKKAYGLDIDTIKIDNSGTISESEIVNNNDTISNIPISTIDLVEKDANISLNNVEHKYYEYVNTIAGLYNINGQNKLVYITPREISNNIGTYNNKTYEYTHGYGVIVTDASNTTSNGNINYLQKDFEGLDTVVNIEQPRIYYGMKTNNTVVTNSNSKKEFDYPNENLANDAENIYDGNAGLSARFLDRIILAIKEHNANLLFSGNVKSDSKILTQRNIIKRAKTIMPYLTYDEEPYMVITNSGKLVWVLDAYTVSNNYPYSQRTVLKDIGINKDEINYIRNSVKVIIDAYNGDITFYITDSTDPIIAAYKSIYKTLFTTEKIPEEISNHLVYPRYLYRIQTGLIKRYHDIEADELYRSYDVWDIATQNTTQVSSKTGTEMAPYYTMLKTTDSNSSRLGLVLPYTPYEKQNIVAYLVGSVDENGNSLLKIYEFNENNNVIGPMQVDSQIEQDEKISSQINAINVTGTRIIKNMIIVPVNNTLLYVEPIYQQYVNEENTLPILKAVVIASGNKIAIGSNFNEALDNLVSQEAINIEVENTDNLSELMDAVIRANNNLKASTQSNDWEQIGRDTKKLQELITRLETVKIEQDKEMSKVSNEAEE